MNNRSMAQRAAAAVPPKILTQQPSGVPGVVVVTPEELSVLVQSAVREALATAGHQEVREVLRLEEVAELLGRHPKHVMRQLVRVDGLPVHYISEREPRFKRSEVLAWLDTRPSTPTKQAGIVGQDDEDEDE